MSRLRTLAERWPVAAVGLLVGVQLRLAHLATWGALPVGRVLLGDGAQDDRWAWGLAQRGLTAEPAPFFVDPLYPNALALLYRLIGHSLLGARLLGVCASLALGVALTLLARRAFGPLAGACAAWLWAHLLPDVFFAVDVGKTELGLALFAWSLWCLQSPRQGARVAAGVLAGLAVLTRGHLGVVAALVLVLPSSRKLTGIKWFGVGLGLAVLPVTAWNAVAGHEVVLTTTGLGANFYLGHNEAAQSGGYDALPFVRADAQYEELDFHREAERRAGHALSASATSRFWLGQGVAFAVAHPALTAGRVLNRAWLVLNDFEVGDTFDLKTLRPLSRVLRLPLVGFGWVVVLAVMGAALRWRDDAVRRLVALAAALAGAIALFFVLGRFRVFLVPLLLPVAASLPAAVADAVAARAWRPLGLAGVLGLVAGVACFWPPPLARWSPVVGPIPVAAAAERTGDVGLARRLLDEAVRAGPDTAAPVCARGQLRARLSEAAGALEDLRRCVALDPLVTEAWEGLARLEDAAGHPAEARAALERAARLRPTDEGLGEPGPPPAP